MEIHRTGYAWKYIRASMTLAGFLPPMTDEEGNMLVDGGYMDNLTVIPLHSLPLMLMSGGRNERPGRRRNFRS
jgi:predicted acylesterase/phospholipase RssA